MPMFGQFGSESFVREISLLLEHQIFMPNTYIISKGQVGEEMYFIDEGRVSILHEDQRSVIAQLERGRYFGEMALFLEQTRIAYVKADNYCSLFMLRKKDLLSLLQTYPRIEQEFKREAERRMDETQKKLVQIQRKPTLNTLTIGRFLSNLQMMPPDLVEEEKEDTSSDLSSV